MFLRYLGTLTSWTDAIECLSSQFQYHKEVWWSIDIFRLFSISSEATVNFIVLKESRLTWKRQFCQMGSLLSITVLWSSYLTGTCLNSISFSQQYQCWLHLSGVGMYHLITRSRKMNIDWGKKSWYLLTDQWQIRHGGRLK